MKYVKVYIFSILVLLCCLYCKKKEYSKSKVKATLGPQDTVGRIEPEPAGLTKNLKKLKTETKYGAEATINVTPDKDRKFVEYYICNKKEPEDCDPSKDEAKMFTGDSYKIGYSKYPQADLYIRACLRDKKGNKNCQSDYEKSDFYSPDNGVGVLASYTHELNQKDAQIRTKCAELFSKIKSALRDKDKIKNEFDRIVNNINNMGEEMLCDLLISDTLSLTSPGKMASINTILMIAPPSEGNEIVQAEAEVVPVETAVVRSVQKTDSLSGGNVIVQNKAKVVPNEPISSDDELQRNIGIGLLSIGSTFFLATALYIHRCRFSKCIDTTSEARNDLKEMDLELELEELQEEVNRLEIAQDLDDFKSVEELENLIEKRQGAIQEHVKSQALAGQHEYSDRFQEARGHAANLDETRIQAPKKTAPGKYNNVGILFQNTDIMQYNKSVFDVTITNKDMKELNTKNPNDYSVELKSKIEKIRNTASANDHQFFVGISGHGAPGLNYVQGDEATNTRTLKEHADMLNKIVGNIDPTSIHVEINSCNAATCLASDPKKTMLENALTDFSEVFSARLTGGASPSFVNYYHAASQKDLWMPVNRSGVYTLEGVNTHKVIGGYIDAYFDRSTNKIVSAVVNFPIYGKVSFDPLVLNLVQQRAKLILEMQAITNSSLPENKLQIEDKKVIYENPDQTKMETKMLLASDIDYVLKNYASGAFSEVDAQQFSKYITDGNIKGSFEFGLKMKKANYVKLTNKSLEIKKAELSAHKSQFPYDHDYSYKDNSKWAGLKGFSVMAGVVALSGVVVTALSLTGDKSKDASLVELLTGTKNPLNDILRKANAKQKKLFKYIVKISNELNSLVKDRSLILIKIASAS